MNDIEAILKAAIQTKVVEAFNTTPEMIDKLVEAALSKEVNEYGGKPEYRDRLKMPFMEWLVGEEIRKAVAECVKDYIGRHKDEIAARVKASIQGGEYGAELARAAATILTEDWRWNVSLQLTRDK